MLKIISISHEAAGTTVQWQSVSGRNYFVERSENLAAAPAFLTLQSNLTANSGTTTFTDIDATGDGPFFYRVGVQP